MKLTHCFLETLWYKHDPHHLLNHVYVGNDLFWHTVLEMLTLAHKLGKTINTLDVPSFLLQNLNVVSCRPVLQFHHFKK